MAAPTYNVNYEDERFGKVEAEEKQALTELEQTYGGMIDQSDKYYQDQINVSKEWADKQTQLQQEQTDFTIEQVEQQKDQAHKDYLKEQSGAYKDWQKQSNQYGAEAEKMASAGLANTGYSESMQVSMYNTYQNRVASARESYNKAVLNYDNAIKDARIQNNVALAEIAYKALQEQTELALQGIQYKNSLIIEQANKKTELDNTYYNRYLDVLNQINTENTLAEEVRQYEQNYALQTKQLEEEIRQFNQNYQLELDKYNESIRQFNVEIERLKKKDDEEAKQQAAELELKKQQLEEEKRQFEVKMAEEKRQFDQTYALQKSKAAGGGNDVDNTVKTGTQYGTVKSEKERYGTNNPVNPNSSAAAAGKTYKTTEYYSGYLPISTQSANLKYGTFDNGYQPKGINGYGAVSKTGDKVTVTATTRDGKTKKVKQNIWKTSDGTLWVWDGSQMKYKKVS